MRGAKPAAAAAVVALLSAVEARGQDEGGVPLAARLPAGARSLALGGVSPALRDADALFGNPALAGTAPGSSLTIARYGDAASAGLLSGAMTLGPVGLAVGTHYLDYGREVDVLDETGPSSGSLTTRGGDASLSLIGAAAASLAWKGMRWGVGAKYAEERGEGRRSSVVAADVGAARDFLNGRITLGLAAQNLGPSMREGGAKRELATRVALGAAGGGVALGAYVDLSAAATVAVLGDGFVAGSIGGELQWVPIEGIAIAGRLGARRAEMDEQRPVVAGLGASFDRLSVDYAWEQLRSGGAHRFTARVR